LTYIPAILPIRIADVCSRTDKTKPVIKRGGQASDFKRDNQATTRVATGFSYLGLLVFYNGARTTK